MMECGGAAPLLKSLVKRLLLSLVVFLLVCLILPSRRKATEPMIEE